MEFFLDKVRKCINHWANCGLSFVGRVVLLRHVIRAMPIYHFMSMSIDPKIYKRLEVICRTFLWGANPRGNSKKALVAWNKIAIEKAKGGLGFVPFQKLSLSLKIPWFGKLLAYENLIWVKLAKEGILMSLDRGMGCRT